VHLKIFRYFLDILSSDNGGSRPDLLSLLLPEILARHLAEPFRHQLCSRTLSPGGSLYAAFSAYYFWSTVLINIHF